MRKFDIKTCDPGFKEVLTKQCKCAKIDINKINFNHPRWYSINSWTQKQEAKFKSWFVETLYTNNKLRKLVMACPIKTKRAIRNVYSFWNLQYGFRVSDDTNI